MAAVSPNPAKTSQASAAKAEKLRNRQLQMLYVVRDVAQSVDLQAGWLTHEDDPTRLRLKRQEAKEGLKTLAEEISRCKRLGYPTVSGDCFDQTAWEHRVGCALDRMYETLQEWIETACKLPRPWRDQSLESVFRWYEEQGIPEILGAAPAEIYEKAASVCDRCNKQFDEILKKRKEEVMAICSSERWHEIAVDQERYQILMQCHDLGFSRMRKINQNYESLLASAAVLLPSSNQPEDADTVPDAPNKRRKDTGKKGRPSLEKSSDPKDQARFQAYKILKAVKDKNPTAKPSKLLELLKDNEEFDSLAKKAGGTKKALCKAFLTQLRRNAIPI